MNNYSIEVWESPNWSKRLTRQCESDDAAQSLCETMAASSGYDVSASRRLMGSGRFSCVAYAKAGQPKPKRGFEPNMEVRTYCGNNEEHYGIVCERCGCCEKCCECME